MVSPSRRGLPAPSRRSRPSLSRLWYETRNSTVDDETIGRSEPSKIKSTNKNQGTTDVRIDPQLNKKVWEQGVKGVGYRLRVRISRRRNDEEGATEKLYSYVQAVNVKNPKGLPTVVVEE